VFHFSYRSVGQTLLRRERLVRRIIIMVENPIVVPMFRPFSLFGIAQGYSSGLRAGWSGVRVPSGAGNLSLHHRVQTCSGAHPTSYPLGTRGSFHGGKAAGGVKLTTYPYLMPRSRMHGAIPLLPICLRGVVLS
jgi:hypothetical protein